MLTHTKKNTEIMAVIDYGLEYTHMSVYARTDDNVNDMNVIRLENCGFCSRLLIPFLFCSVFNLSLFE